MEGQRYPENWAGEKGLGAAPTSLLLSTLEQDSWSCCLGGNSLPLQEPSQVLLLQWGELFLMRANTELGLY